MPPVVPPFLIGLVAASLVKRLGKPVVRGLVKTTVSIGIEAKRAVTEAGEGIHDLAAEATAEALAAQMSHGAEPAAAGAPQGASRTKPAGKARSTASAPAKAR
ncbi:MULTISPECIES: DUF5132 domain-containing protein [Streptomyces]|uniref:DUF5132 domain-containing protein n=1 Tax=Streptomyces TaxID=1883 RepID=UPI001CCF8F9D|nr:MULTISPECIES: DUF5132 domain-containing protein [Streptomyces]MBZ6249561.1 DUF5132 domain-containing protein [Streptomyces olivaceus]MCU8595003.1 DUF5132 domain-containing protein [Streptomyces sp. A13(2022)]